jgi:predicted transglutaminase-like cysteine proteinase
VGQFKLPPATTWVDAETFEPLKMEFDFPGFGGKVCFLRTTKDAASVAVARPIELFNAQSIRLDREIPGIHTGRSIVYKVSAPKDDEPGSLFPTDARQAVKNLDEKAKTFELHVAASHGPARGANPLPAPGKEFIQSNYFINWDNDGVKKHAASAVVGLPGTATDWEKAVAVEKWVNRNMKAFEFSQAMATADNVAKTLSGDCTEYAMLSAAMCRAVGVPSRTVLGLVYAPTKDGKPFLAYHMWFEVFAEGQWLPLDATLALGGVGPGHLKIADHSWYEEKTFAPLLPVLRVLSAKPAVTVTKVEP